MCAGAEDECRKDTQYPTVSVKIHSRHEGGRYRGPVSTPDSPPPDFTAEDHRRLAVRCNNTTWDMIEADRTPANDEEMLRRAYAAAYHWQHAEGRGPVNEVRALWLLAKVHLVAGLADRALHYADACLVLCADHGVVDFDLAYARAARAGALALLGLPDEAAAEWAAAKAVPIADAEDRAQVESDLAVGP